MSGYQNRTHKHSRSATIMTRSKMLGSTSFDTYGQTPGEMTMEVHETQGGALIARLIFEPDDQDREGWSKGCVVKPQDDKKAMHLEVMDFFDWHQRAQSWAGKELGWSLRIEVE